MYIEAIIQAVGNPYQGNPGCSNPGSIGVDLLTGHPEMPQKSVATFVDQHDSMHGLSTVAV
jgi:hypothetical protein